MSETSQKQFFFSSANSPARLRFVKAKLAPPQTAHEELPLTLEDSQAFGYALRRLALGIYYPQFFNTSQSIAEHRSNREPTTARAINAYLDNNKNQGELFFKNKKFWFKALNPFKAISFLLGALDLAFHRVAIFFDNSDLSHEIQSVTPPVSGLLNFIRRLTTDLAIKITEPILSPIDFLNNIKRDFLIKETQGAAYGGLLAISALLGAITFLAFTTPTAALAALPLVSLPLAGVFFRVLCGIIDSVNPRIPHLGKLEQPPAIDMDDLYASSDIDDAYCKMLSIMPPKRKPYIRKNDTGQATATCLPTYLGPIVAKFSLPEDDTAPTPTISR